MANKASSPHDVRLTLLETDLEMLTEYNSDKEDIQYNNANYA